MRGKRKPARLSDVAYILCKRAQGLLYFPEPGFFCTRSDILKSYRIEIGRLKWKCRFDIYETAARRPARISSSGRVSGRVTVLRGPPVLPARFVGDRGLSL